MTRSFEIGVAVAVTLATIALTIGATMFVVVRIPEDHFVGPQRPLPLEGRPLPLRIAARVALNLVGLVLILVGVLLSLPGIPGQGLLTILLGLMLVELPGKRRVERALVRRPLVHGAINRVRARFGKPPILVPT